MAGRRKIVSELAPFLGEHRDRKETNFSFGKYFLLSLQQR